jgi:CubicO group peptidase (beta-lactamase class C family)
MKRTLGFLFCFYLALPGLAQVKPAETPPAPAESIETKVDKIFAEWDKWDSPGAALAVLRDGRVVYKRGCGCAQLEYNIPITPSTIFHVASVSKQFTAFAVAMLASQGKLSLEDDIRKYLPEVPEFGKTVSVKHLIYHTSGLRDQWEALAIAGWRLDDVITKDHILKMVCNQRELNFSPGDEYLYCNTGYTLLAEIVARVTGRSFPDWSAENIFKPLGMSNTHFHDDHEMIVKNMAYSYSQMKDGTYKKNVLSYANVGATSLFTTVEDLCRWVQNFEDARVGGPGIIRQIQEQGVLNNGKKLDYAFGLSIGEHRGLRTVGHSGGDAGYRSHVVWFPDQDFGVAVLSNLGSLAPGQLALKVAEVYLSDKMAPEKTKPGVLDLKPVKVDASILDTYVGKYELQIGRLLVLTREGDKLMGEFPGDEKVELIPESESRFFVKEAGGSLTFERNKEGRIAGFAFTAGGQTIPARKLMPPVLKAEALAEFSGDYDSPELQTTYSLSIKDGKLIAGHPRNPDTHLEPSDIDQFSGDNWWFGKIKFERDESKKISGFILSGSRVRNLRFIKK